MFLLRSQLSSCNDMPDMVSILSQRDRLNYFTVFISFVLFFPFHTSFEASQVALVVEKEKKKPACQCRREKRHGFDPWVGKITWRRKQQPTPVFLPGEPHGQRSLVNYSPWGCRFRHKWTDLVHFFWYLRKSLGFCPNGPSYINTFI